MARKVGGSGRLRFALVLLGFVAAVLGGMGSSLGALAGGLLVGVISKLVGGYVSTAAEHGIAFALLMLALAVRPQGLFGRPEVSKALTRCDRG